jgi:hypothetical protein
MRFDAPTGRDGTRTALATLGLFLLPLACCGVAVLIAAGALGAAGSVLGNPWMIGTAVLVAAGGASWLLRRHTSQSSAAVTIRRATRGHGEDCCPPASGPAGHAADETTSEHRHG